MTGASGTPRVLHIHGSLAAGNPQADRSVRLIQAFGARLRHTLVAADGDFGALDGIAKGIALERNMSFPELAGFPSPGRLQRIARGMIDYHLVLTYGRGGIGAALAHTTFSEVHALPPLIHHEDGSDETAAQRRGLRSRWSRRVGLGKAAGLVVPSETMEGVALDDWQQPLGRVKLIPDGVDLRRSSAASGRNAIGRLVKRGGEYWLGCFADGASDEVAPWIEALGSLDTNWHLVIMGNAAVHAGLEAIVTHNALDHRVHFLAPPRDVGSAMALFDMVAVAGGAAPLPLMAVEAMAAGKPVLGLSAAETNAALAPENASLGRSDLDRLATDAELRHAVGEANRARARAERDEAAMVAAYRRLYTSAMGIETI